MAKGLPIFITLDPRACRPLTDRKHVWQALCLEAGTRRTHLHNSVVCMWCDVYTQWTTTFSRIQNLTIHYEEKIKEERMGGTCGMHGSETCAELVHFMLPPRCKWDVQSFGII